MIFQFTPLREGRLTPRCAKCTIYGFQFTPLREGRHVDTSAAVIGVLFQFTPLREGRPISAQESTENKQRISIHAPARGATGRSPTFSPVGALFQFTPLREGRRYTWGASIQPNIFQFTPLREGRPGHRQQPRRCRNFNSRPCERGDICRFYVDGKSLKFQFTPLREGRR